MIDLRSDGGERGSEVPGSSLLQNQLLERQVRHRLAQSVGHSLSRGPSPALPGRLSGRRTPCISGDT